MKKSLLGVNTKARCAVNVRQKRIYLDGELLYLVVKPVILAVWFPRCSFLRLCRIVFLSLVFIIILRETNMYIPLAYQCINEIA